MLVIFSKLNISAYDHAWIEAIRVRHDPQQQMVDPHFTFVFPFEGLSSDEVFGHAQTVANEASPIRFRLAQAAAVRDPLSPRSHLFLLPTEGAPAMHILHDRLYSGVLAPKLHPTVIYTPHVTVGAFAEHQDAERTSATLGAVDIWGALNSIQIADFDGTRVKELYEVPLGPR